MLFLFIRSCNDPAPCTVLRKRVFIEPLSGKEVLRVKPKQALHLSTILRYVMLAFLALFLFVYQAHDTVLFVAALVPLAASLIAYIVVMTLWWRCPHCHKPLPLSPLHGEAVVTHCPYCGGAIDGEKP